LWHVTQHYASACRLSIGESLWTPHRLFIRFQDSLAKQPCDIVEDNPMAVPKAIAEYLSNLRSEIKKVTLDDHTYLIVSARHCAETFRRYMALTTSQSIAIDNVVAKCCNLVEALKQKPALSEQEIKPLRRAALQSVEDLSETVSDAEPSHEATILHLTRK
jgi:hypothetical protein